MFISVAKLYDSYAFLVGDHTGDPPETYLRSLYDSDLVAGLQPTYSTFPEAHSAAARLVHFLPSAVMARKASVLRRKAQEDKVVHTMAPEDRIVDHYSEQYRLMDRRLRQISGEEDKDREEMLGFFLSEVKNIIQGIKALLAEIEEPSNIRELKEVYQDIVDMKQRAKKMKKKNVSNKIKTASSKKLLNDPLPKVLPFVESAALALVHTHETIRVGRIDENHKSGYIVASLEDDNGSVCDLHFSEDLFLCGIIPSRRISASCPYHGRAFLKRYWEPVVSSVGHFMLRGKNLLISTEGMGGSSSFKAINPTSGVETKVNLISDPDDNSWWLRASKICKKASSGLKGKEVKCTKVTLPSYYGRTGTVLNEEDMGSYIEVSVDFRRGLGVLVLTDSDIENVPI